MKYDDLSSTDNFPELPAVLLLLDGILSDLTIIEKCPVCYAASIDKGIDGVIRVLREYHYTLSNSNIVPF